LHCFGLRETKPIPASSLSAHFRPLRCIPSTSRASIPGDAQREADPESPSTLPQRRFRLAASLTSYLLESTMFIYLLLEQIGRLFERAEQKRKDAYLAEASDLADVERRMRTVERNGYPMM
jgi:hypothetical protein